MLKWWWLVAGACALVLVPACSTPPRKSTVGVAAAKLKVVKKGFAVASKSEYAEGVPYQRIAYTFTVRNTDGVAAVFGGRYAVEFVDAHGAAVGRDSNDLGAVLPGSLTAVSEVADASSAPADMRITLYGGSEEDAKDFQPIAPVPGAYQSASVVGTILNPYDVLIPAEQIVAVLYDARENIVGGGLAVVDLPKAGQVSVEVRVPALSATPAKATLFPRQVKP